MLQSKHLKEVTKLEELLTSERKEAYFQFLEASCTSQTTKTIHITFPVNCDNPLRWFNHHCSNYPTQFYWEIPSHPSAIAALGCAQKLSFEGENRFQLLEKALFKADSTIASFNLSGHNLKNTPRWVGGFSFYPEINSAAWEGFQPASFVLPELGIIKENGLSTGYVSVNLSENTTPKDLHHEIVKRTLLFASEYFENGYSGQSTVGKQLSDAPGKIQQDEFQKWEEAIQDAKAQFHSNEMEKVVLTRKKQFSFEEPCHPVHALFQLREQYPKGCSFLIKNEDSPTFLGCSPELFLSAKDHSIETEALAGSIARGNTRPKDNELAEKLFVSSKDQTEHDYVVRSIRETLSPFLSECEIPGYPVMKKLPNVQHLYTPIEGEMRDSATILQMIEKLHPTPAVGGTPRSSALSFIKTREPFERGWFASPVGWISSSGEANFYVAIRSGLVGEEKALLFAGCGIVADSDPQLEWEEADLKFKPMLSVLNNGQG